MRKYLLIAELFKIGKSKEEIEHLLSSNELHNTITMLYGEEVATQYTKENERKLSSMLNVLESKAKTSRSIELISEVMKNEKSVIDIASQFNVSHQHIYGLLKRLNINRKELVLQRSQKALNEIRDGAIADDVAKKYGYSTSYLQSRARLAGIDIKRKKKLKDDKSVASKIRRMLLQGYDSSKISIALGVTVQYVNTVKNRS